MEMIFEDAFMDAQASMVSLCVEFLDSTNNRVDKIYIYTNCDECSFFFNVFFEKDNQTYGTGDLFNKEDVKDLINYGNEDLFALFNVCKNYNRQCPYQMKLVYDTHSHQFDADYRYEEFNDDEDGPTFQFINWRKAINKQLRR